MKFQKTYLVLLIAMLFALPLYSEEEQKDASKEESISLDKSLKGVKLGVLTYIDYSNGTKPAANDEGDKYNQFKVTRGYLTLKKKFTPWLKARITHDMHQVHESDPDEQGDNEGDYVVRVKYAYGEVHFPDVGSILTYIKSEIGIGHMPWLDFEEHMNFYRCQGTMAIERAGNFNSADAGIGLMGYFGPELENAEKKTGNHYYTGKFGSWHVGVYNGAGYHGVESNTNKVIEGRVTIRPFFMIAALSGLQVSYLGINGKGNKKQTKANGEEIYPWWNVQNCMVSYQHPYVTITGQYFITNGNQKGKMVDSEKNPLKTNGYSVFADITLPALDNRIHLIGRYDFFDADADDKIAEKTSYNMLMAGVVVKLHKSNMLVLAYEKTDYEENSAGIGAVPVAGEKLGKDEKLQAVLQLKF